MQTIRTTETNSVISLGEVTVLLIFTLDIMQFVRIAEVFMIILEVLIVQAVILFIEDTVMETEYINRN